MKLLEKTIEKTGEVNLYTTNTKKKLKLKYQDHEWAMYTSRHNQQQNKRIKLKNKHYKYM